MSVPNVITPLKAVPANVSVKLTKEQAETINENNLSVSIRLNIEENDLLFISKVIDSPRAIIKDRLKAYYEELVKFKEDLTKGIVTIDKKPFKDAALELQSNYVVLVVAKVYRDGIMLPGTINISAVSFVSLDSVKTGWVRNVHPKPNEGFVEFEQRAFVKSETPVSETNDAEVLSLFTGTDLKASIKSLYKENEDGSMNSIKALRVKARGYRDVESGGKHWVLPTYAFEIIGQQ